MSKLRSDSLHKYCNVTSKKCSLITEIPLLNSEYSSGLHTVIQGKTLYLKTYRFSVSGSALLGARNGCRIWSWSEPPHKFSPIYYFSLFPIAIFLFSHFSLRICMIYFGSSWDNFLLSHQLCPRRHTPVGFGLNRRHQNVQLVVLKQASGTKHTLWQLPLWLKGGKIQTQHLEPTAESEFGFVQERGAGGDETLTFTGRVRT